MVNDACGIEATAMMTMAVVCLLELSLVHIHVPPHLYLLLHSFIQTHLLCPVYHSLSLSLSSFFVSLSPSFLLDGGMGADDDDETDGDAELMMMMMTTRDVCCTDCCGCCLSLDGRGFLVEGKGVSLSASDD